MNIVDTFVGIDVAFAKKKFLPISVCIWRNGILEPLPLRSTTLPLPPRGSGNAKILDNAIVKDFAESTARYLREVERTFSVTIRRIAIDAPSDPKTDGALRREAEKGLDKKKISCFTTPDSNEFCEIRAKAQAHLANGGEESRLPHANQLWMLVGFELFRRLRQEWECLEVFPQAIVSTLGANGIHKTKGDGLLKQLATAAVFTGWPKSPKESCLREIGYGLNHDNFDAYLAAWVASLEIEDREAIGHPPNDAIWIPRLTAKAHVGLVASSPAPARAHSVQVQSTELTGGRYLLFLDLLGFTDLVTHTSTKEIIQTINDALQPFLEWEKLNTYFKTIYFSDTFLFYQEPKGYHRRCFLDVYALAAMITSSLLAKGIPSRGAITFGEFEVEFDNSGRHQLYCGKALIEAYKAERKENWIGVTIQPSAWKPFEDSNQGTIKKFETEGVWRTRSDGVLLLNPLITLHDYYISDLLHEITVPYSEWDAPSFPNDLKAFWFIHDKAKEYEKLGDFSGRASTKYFSTIAFLRDVLGEEVYQWALKISPII